MKFKNFPILAHYYTKNFWNSNEDTLIGGFTIVTNKVKKFDDITTDMLNEALKEYIDITGQDYNEENKVIFLDGSRDVVGVCEYEVVIK